MMTSSHKANQQPTNLNLPGCASIHEKNKSLFNVSFLLQGNVYGSNTLQQETAKELENFLLCSFIYPDQILTRPYNLLGTLKT